MPHLSMADGAPARPLTEDEANNRSQIVRNVKYDLWFRLREGFDTFEGKTTITFEIDPAKVGKQGSLFIDIVDAEIETVNLNNRFWAKTPKESYDGNRLTIPFKDLKERNIVEVIYSHAYQTNGVGLHRFRDPADNAIYLYTQMEPYDARRMFPCFDQPDIKATYTMTVEAPLTWNVVSNTTPAKPVEKKNHKVWAFPESAKFSTYLVALHAGPYVEWSGKAGDIPMSLYARKSIAQQVDHEEWLEVTKNGLSWFAKTFGYAYPFKKYDQVIVPDFNAGAMENVAAVTFSERFAPRTKMTTDQRRDRADVILHEMAHMWFGDLVTMKWWNGLWLNESFASYMAAWAVAESTKFPGAWQDFNQSMKNWAMTEDELVTTHPIESKIGTTDDAFSNFDGITYGKGAAALHQLRYFLGTDAFKAGLKHYFSTYAYQNTSIDDFMGSLSTGSGKDLKEWRKKWLETSGINTAEAKFDCDYGKIKSFELIQGEGNGDSVLRPHRTQVVIYRKKGKAIQPIATESLEYSRGKTEIPSFIGKECPDLVDTNNGDYDYAKLKLDEKSLKTVETSLSQIGDPFIRQRFWMSLWGMVRDAKYPAQNFIETALTHLGKESDTQILSNVLNQAFVPRYEAPALKYLDPKLYSSYVVKGERFIRDRLAKARHGSDEQLILFRAITQLASSPDTVNWLKAVFEGKNEIPGIKLDPEMRWSLIQMLARNGRVNKEIDEELAKDKTDDAQKQAALARALIPNEASKRAYMESAKKPPMKYSLMKQVIRGLYPMGQESVTEKLADDYFTVLPEVVKTGDESLIGTFAENAFVPKCSDEHASKTKKFISNNSSLPSYVVKALQVNQQWVERCTAARKLSETTKVKGSMALN